MEYSGSNIGQVLDLSIKNTVVKFFGSQSYIQIFDLLEVGTPNLLLFKGKR